MRRALILSIAWLAVFLIPGACLAASQSGPVASTPSWKLSRSQLHNLLRNKPSVESCEELTAYFRGREEDYRNQVQQMNELVMQRESTAEHAGGKYEQSVDSARHLRDYYLQMEQEMGARAAMWARKGQQLQ